MTSSDQRNPSDRTESTLVHDDNVPSDHNEVESAPCANPGLPPAPRTSASQHVAVEPSGGMATGNPGTPPPPRTGVSQRTAGRLSSAITAGSRGVPPHPSETSRRIAGDTSVTLFPGSPDAPSTALAGGPQQTPGEPSHTTGTPQVQRAPRPEDRVQFSQDGTYFRTLGDLLPDGARIRSPWHPLPPHCRAPTPAVTPTAVAPQPPYVATPVAVAPQLSTVHPRAPAPASSINSGQSGLDPPDILVVFSDEDETAELEAQPSLPASPNQQAGRNQQSATHGRSPTRPQPAALGDDERLCFARQAQAPVALTPGASTPPSPAILAA